MKTIALLGGVVSLLVLVLPGCVRDPLFNNSQVPSSEIPRVLLLEPAQNRTNIPVNTRISILFSEPMNAASVFRSLHVHQNGVKINLKEGALQAYDREQLFIYRDEALSFSPDAKVTVRVDAVAEDAEGYHLGKDVEWRFVTSTEVNGDTVNPRINLSTLSPANREVVGPASSVSIEFTEGMIRGTVERSFRVVAAPGGEDERDCDDGVFTWHENRVVYMPRAPLALRDALYEVRLDDNGIICTDLAGNPLEHPAGDPVIRFYTISDDVIYVSPSGDDTYEGTSKFSPKATLSAAVEKAEELSSQGFNVVKVEAGAYVDSVEMIDGISIYGGYPPGFDETATRGVSVVQAPVPSDGAPYTFVFPGVRGCTLDTLAIFGPSASPSPAHVAGIGAVMIGAGSEGIIIRFCSITGTGGGALDAAGVLVEGSSDVTVKGCSISGGNGGGRTAGVRVIGPASGVSIQGNSVLGGTGPADESIGIGVENATVLVFGNPGISGGNGSGNAVGIRVEGAGNGSVIEQNGAIEGGSAGEATGIKAGGSSLPVIRDNSLIVGGSASGGDACGILVSGGARPSIFRNRIIGGEASGGGGCAVGVKYDNDPHGSGSNVLANNFILGARQGNGPFRESFGVYARNTNVSIVNNTIDGGGNPAGTARTFGIYADDTTPSWQTVIEAVNNYLIGGSTGTTYGIFLNSDEPSLDCRIFNNVFNNFLQPPQHSCAGSIYAISGTVEGLNGALGALLFLHPPQGNISDSNDPGLAFTGRNDGDYHPKPSSPSLPLIVDRGYEGGCLAILPDELYADPGIMTDIDRKVRTVTTPGGNTDFGLVDLGAVEVN
jgi:hypothetical protein